TVLLLSPSSHVYLSLFLFTSFSFLFFFFFNDTATTEIYTLSLHDALPISIKHPVTHRTCIHASYSLRSSVVTRLAMSLRMFRSRSEEHTSELQSLTNLVCRLLLEKKKKKKTHTSIS